jgi:hypothetical protein
VAFQQKALLKGVAQLHASCPAMASLAAGQHQVWLVDVERIQNLQSGALPISIMHILLVVSPRTAAKVDASPSPDVADHP